MPHSFVMHRGDVGKAVLQLEMDIRHVMEPFTATKLKVITWIPCDLLCASGPSILKFSPKLTLFAKLNYLPSCWHVRPNKLHSVNQ